MELRGSATSKVKPRRVAASERGSSGFQIRVWTFPEFVASFRVIRGQKKSGAAAPHSKISVLSAQSAVKSGWRLTQNALQLSRLVAACRDGALAKVGDLLAGKTLRYLRFLLFNLPWI